MVVLRIGEEQYSESEEEDIDQDKQRGGERHVLLGFPQAPAGEVLLHHILIKSSHSDADADT